MLYDVVYAIVDFRDDGLVMMIGADQRMQKTFIEGTDMLR